MNDFLENKFNDLFRGKAPLRSGAKGNGRFAVATSIGLVRNANEDRCALMKVRFGGKPARDFNLGIVCDGLGGMEAGQEAAMSAVAAFMSTLIQGGSPSPIERLRRAVGEANNRVYGFLRARGGTTLTAAMVTRDGSYFCHVGDSRLYVIGPERSVIQVTRDDTMAALLGKGSPEGERDHRLVQFVGLGDEIEPQVAPIGQIGGTLLLTTDGAHDVPPSIFQRAVSAATSPGDLAKRLTQLSDILGGRDNSSVVVMASFLDDNLNPGSDAEIVITLPTDEFRIWLTPYAEALTPDRLPSLPTSDDKPGFTRRRATKPKAKKATPSKPKKRSPKKSDAAELPLEEPGVNVEFPNQTKGTE